MRTKGKSGFTIIELITVIAMILVLMGSVTASVTGARRRAKVQQAITEAQQLTDAILAYENFARPGRPSPLEDKKTGESWKEATESEMKFVLGNDKMPNGQEGVSTGKYSKSRVLDPVGLSVMAVSEGDGRVSVTDFRSVTTKNNKHAKRMEYNEMTVVYPRTDNGRGYRFVIEYNTESDEG